MRRRGARARAAGGARLPALAAALVLLLAPAAGAADDDPYDAARLAARRAAVPATPDNLAAGKAVYLQRCAMCHGEQGRGDGGAAAYLEPRPRDFSKGLFKFRSTASGELPTDEDLFRVVSRGVPGTAMPAWGEGTGALPEVDRWRVVHHVKTLVTDVSFTSPEFDPYAPGRVVPIPEPPPVTPERIAAGRALFLDEKKGACVKCHGAEGRGDGVDAVTMKDDWGDAIWPRDMTKPWLYKNGTGVRDIYRTFTTGLNGTPMPGFVDTLAEGERWDLAMYVRSLLTEPARAVVLEAERREGPLPADPADPVWAALPYVDVPLMGQVVAGPRMHNAAIDSVTVRALHNGAEVAFHLSWNDRRADRAPPAAEDTWFPALPEPDTYVKAAWVWARRGTVALPDRIALQFPVKPRDGPEKPFFFMGDGSNPVNLWIWRADRDSVVEAAARGHEKGPRAIEGKRAVGAAAVFEAGRWRVVLRRAIDTGDPRSDVAFVPGRLVPFALQAWDGANGEEGLLCSISSWHYVLLEAAAPASTFLLAALAALATAGLSLVLVRAARRSPRGRPAGAREAGCTS